MHYTIDVVVAAIVAVALYTHAPLRFWIWSLANLLACNSDDEEEGEYEYEKSESSEVADSEEKD